ncbi:sensor histidine kinase [Vulgatibacter incomptus]|uniref:histidine kinase n=1 Tax=Vulgatibacter incomptus TaxID=1391653 RepID=A0A0K1PHZ4_9BACT|nr:ATP-binding protein [Vulgatibacter incomptus]AKU93137.1 integral membrane sensor signal transduction histidine kinase [Vulgatibacter incomptus]
MAPPESLPGAIGQQADGKARRLRLGSRFLLAAGLLVCTTVATGVFTVMALSRLTVTIDDTLRASDETTSTIARLAGGLEREDDALLLALDTRGTRVPLEAQRAEVDEALHALRSVATSEAETALADSLSRSIAAYRRAGDGIASAGDDPLALYRERANPLLRKAVIETGRLRALHFEAMGRVAAVAGEEARRATRIVFAIALAAFGISALIALHLARIVIRPLRALSHGADEIRRGNFGERLPVQPGDELGDLAETFNRMAEELASFRATNLGEVLRAKRTLEATLGALPDAVLLVDSQKRVVARNPAAQALLGEAGRLDELPIPDSAKREVERAIDEVQGSTPPVDLGSAIPLASSGEAQRFLPRMLHVPELFEGAGGAILVLSDVTELARVDEMRAELVAVASHELRTPLTTLRMTLLMLEEGAAALSDRQRELVSTSVLGAAQLASTIDEYLDLTRIEAGQLRLDREPIEPAALVRDAIARAATLAADSGVRLETAIPDRLPLVVGDGARLRLVLDNVLSNALKYTPWGGRVAIEAAEEDGAIRIGIADTGPGIPAEYSERVFEKFFRVEHHLPNRERGGRGAGIGLYLCREIVGLHGGTIRCDEAPGGSGTRFTVRIPIQFSP